MVGSIHRNLAGWAVAGLLCVGMLPASSFGATAKSLNQPFSSFSASLFGKTDLSARQTQTLTADPAAPLYGATSLAYDPGIVGISGYGFGPGYHAWSGRPEQFPSGFGIELDFAGVPTSEVALKAVPKHPTTTDVIDLGDYLAGSYPGAVETGYLQVFYESDGTGSTGKYIPSGETMIASNAPIAGGIDTHYLTFLYNLGVPNNIPASYRVYDDFGNRASGNLTDFMASGNPSSPDITAPGEIFDAVIFGSVPEPGALALVMVTAGVCAVRRRSRRA